MADRARLQGCDKAVTTILGRRRRFWPTHECNFLIAPRQKRFSGQLPGGKIIDAKRVDARRSQNGDQNNAPPARQRCQRPQQSSRARWRRPQSHHRQNIA